jgi:hypothetical protein
VPAAIGWKICQDGLVERVLTLENIPHHNLGLRVCVQETLGNRSEAIVDLHRQEVDAGVSEMNGEETTARSHFENEVSGRHL